MTDHDDLHLGERMGRAVSGLRAPDVTADALARGRRHRTQRRLGYAAGGVAAATALVLTVPALAGSGGTPRPSTPVATDPSTGDGPTAGAGERQGCPGAETGWWSSPSEQVRADLAALLPPGTRVVGTDESGPGRWGGTVATGDDRDFVGLALLPPPGVPGGRLTLEELAEGGACAGGANAPMREVAPCATVAETRAPVACEDVRDEDGDLVGVVVEQVEEGTGRPYVVAVVGVPGGGHVELYAAAGTRADRPGTAYDPGDVPALTRAQAREVVTDPAWTD